MVGLHGITFNLNRVSNILKAQPSPKE